jgi:hypothetical protein
MEGRSSSVGFCGEHNFFALFPTMVLSVGDRVKSRATLYDAGTEDEEGNTFSQRQLGKGLGAFCYGAVTHVYRKVGRQSQKYRVRWDDGTISQVLSEHLELVSVQEGSRDVGGGPDINEDQDFDRFVTVDGEETDEEGVEDQGRIEVGEVTRVGGVVEVGGVNWKRVENITRDVREGVERFDLQVKPFVITGATTEKELFWLCMPVSREQLVEVVRTRAGMTLCYPTCYPLLTRTSSPPTKLDESSDKYKEWSATHIDKFLRCIFGGAQYKVCAVYCVSMSISFVSKPVSDLRT